MRYDDLINAVEIMSNDPPKPIKIINEIYVLCASDAQIKRCMEAYIAYLDKVVVPVDPYDIHIDREKRAIRYRHIKYIFVNCNNQMSVDGRKFMHTIYGDDFERVIANEQLKEKQNA